MRKRPFYILLIPIFFVEHGFLENFGFVDVKDILLLVAIYCFTTLFLFLFFFLFYKKNISKAGLTTAYIMVFCLFYGALQFFLKTHVRIIGKHGTLLTIWIIFFVLLLVYLKKTNKNFHRLTFFLNFLFIIYIGIDAALIIKTYTSPPTDKLSIYFHNNNFSHPVANKNTNPDIYFLLFDEYASSLSLKEQYAFTNDLDSFLLNRGFHIQSKSHSNYHYTTFSMASMLNMSYIEGLKVNTTLTVEDMNNCANLIKKDKVIDFLSEQGYEIINYSIFDLAGHPTLVSQKLLPLKTRLITDKTLFLKVYRHLIALFISGRLKIPSLNKKIFYDTDRNNDKLLALTKEETRHLSYKPRFVYAHLYMPHDPFFYDKNGKAKKDVLIKHSTREGRQVQDYLEYLSYTNSKIKGLIDTIRLNTKGQAAIILMGDHGFRSHIEQNLPQNYQNMNAVYFPNKDYSFFYDSISCVNQFRVILNSLFHQSFPLLKDSTIFLKGKE